MKHELINWDGQKKACTVYVMWCDVIWYDMILIEYFSYLISQSEGHNDDFSSLNLMDKQHPLHRMQPFSSKLDISVWHQSFINFLF